MKALSLRIPLAAVVFLGVVLSLATGVQASFVQTERDQQSVYILVNVTPSPIVYVPQAQPLIADRQIAYRMSMRARGSSAKTDSLAGAQYGDLVAMVAPTPTAQADVKVEAEVSPNPIATLLYTNVPNVTLNGVAGTTVKQTCAYTVTVDRLSGYSWTLDDGLSADFAGGFPGGDLADNTYLQFATPQPTSTPFVVYATDGNLWHAVEKSSGMQTYCVDLTLTIPGSVPGGAYSSNAVYTLYF